MSAERTLMTEEQRADKRFDICVSVALLALGIYQSVVYFGHQSVPHFDFPYFPSVARELLSLHIPSNFKRLPVFGLLQVLVNTVVPGVHSDYTAALLVNSILHPLNAVLFWKVGRRMVGKAAAGFAFIAAINPWLLSMLTEATVETTLLFFVLLTLYLLFRRSRLCYAAAAAAAMVRYEAAALVIAAFLADIMEAKDKRARIRAFLYTAAALLPLAVWLLGTVAAWKSQGRTHYIREIARATQEGFPVLQFLHLIWHVAFTGLMNPLGKVKLLRIFVMLLAGSTFLFGSVYGLCKRRVETSAMLLFFIPYILIHAAHGVMLTRYCATVYWIPLLICLYGLLSLWAVARERLKMPAQLAGVAQTAVLISAVVGILAVFPMLAEYTDLSRRSYTLPYIAAGLLCPIAAARVAFYKSKPFLKAATLLAVGCLFVVSNQFSVIATVGNGTRDIEFKYLLDWFEANARPDEKLVTTAAPILKVMAPQYKESFVHVHHVAADSPQEFIDNCRKLDVSYFAWDARIGFYPQNAYYKLWKMDTVAIFRSGRDVGPFQFLTRLGEGNSIINVYRLRPVTSQWTAEFRFSIMAVGTNSNMKPTGALR